MLSLGMASVLQEMWETVSDVSPSNCSELCPISLKPSFGQITRMPAWTECNSGSGEGVKKQCNNTNGPVMGLTGKPRTVQARPDEMVWVYVWPWQLRLPHLGANSRAEGGTLLPHVASKDKEMWEHVPPLPQKPTQTFGGNLAQHFQSPRPM